MDCVSDANIKPMVVVMEVNLTFDCGIVAGEEKRFVESIFGECDFFLKRLTYDEYYCVKNKTAVTIEQIEKLTGYFEYVTVFSDEIQIKSK